MIAPKVDEELGDMRHGVTRAGHEVLDAADERRSIEADWTLRIRRAIDRATSARSGDLVNRRADAIEAAALLVLAIEGIDEELES